MRKFILYILLMILIPLTVFAEDTKTLDVSAVIPEGYGVRIPDKAIRIGDFVLSMDVGVEAESDEFIETTELYAGIFSENNSSFRFNVVYYGNSAESYDVTLRFSSAGFTMMHSENDEVMVPVRLSVTKSDDSPDDVVVETVGLSEARISIPPAGPREKISVLDVRMEWDTSVRVVPGWYQTDIDIELLGE